MTPNDQKLEKLQKLLEMVDADFATNQEVASIFAELIKALEKEHETTEQKIEEIRTIISNLKLQKGDKGDSIQGPPGPTPTNRELIALIEPLIPEAPKASDVASTASKMALDELLPKIPTIESIENDLPKLGEKIRDGLELLHGDERLDISAIKGFGKRMAKFSDELVARWLDILSQRTSFLINKLENLQNQVNQSSGGSGGNTEVPTPPADSATMTFFVVHRPKFMIIDEMARVEGVNFGYTVTGTGPYTITLNSLLTPPSQILSIY